MYYPQPGMQTGWKWSQWVVTHWHFLPTAQFLDESRQPNKRNRSIHRLIEPPADLPTGWSSRWLVEPPAGRATGWSSRRLVDPTGEPPADQAKRNSDDRLIIYNKWITFNNAFHYVWLGLNSQNIYLIIYKVNFKNLIWSEKRPFGSTDRSTDRSTDGQLV